MEKRTVEIEDVLGRFDLSDEDWDSLTDSIQNALITTLEYEWEQDRRETLLINALRAIVARHDGVFDAPELVAYGPLTWSTSGDIKSIAKRALQNIPQNTTQEGKL